MISIRYSQLTLVILQSACYYANFRCKFLFFCADLFAPCKQIRAEALLSEANYEHISGWDPFSIYMILFSPANYERNKSL